MNNAVPSKAGYLSVSDLHDIHYETRGSGGTPVVFLHGGPGGGVRDSDRALLDAHSGLAVLPDQRGAGKSRPNAEIAQNTTAELIADLETLRRHLGIEAWAVVGGSWGSTLALAYGIAHPQRVSALIVHGVFLCRRQELTWFYGAEGAATLFPDEYERFLEPVEASRPGEVVAAYNDLLRHADPATRRATAASWGRWEAVNSFLDPSSEQIAEFTDPETAMTTALLETTYFRNGGYMPENFILDHAADLAHIPCRIVQGRYDTICPMRSAFELYRALPLAELDVVTTAAHDASEIALRARLTAQLRDLESLVGSA